MGPGPGPGPGAGAARRGIEIHAPARCFSTPRALFKLNGGPPGPGRGPEKGSWHGPGAGAGAGEARRGIEINAPARCFSTPRARFMYWFRPAAGGIDHGRRGVGGD